MNFSEWLGIASIVVGVIGIIVSAVGVRKITETKNILQPKEVENSGFQQGNHNTMTNNYGMDAKDIMEVTEKTVDYKIKSEGLVSTTDDTTFVPLEKNEG